ncbi:MAG TPA: H-X9-DG-CTERM domain-containing protein [Pirellulales bacterium]|nr:H-X9-DG-CTERM domain-containing protein [Pirellulales bacterium]
MRTTVTHPGGWNAAFCDGGVRWIHFAIDPAIHRQLANRADQIPIDDGTLGF